jgi:hypothetical protein
METLKRIISSQKAIMTAVGSIAVAYGMEAGVSQAATEIVAALFAVLIAGQTVLDFRHGSPSDKTGKFAPPAHTE